MLITRNSNTSDNDNRASNMIANMNSLRITQKDLRASAFASFAGDHGLTLQTGVLAIISTIIGGGIVGLPYSFLHFGIPLAVVLNIIVIIITILTGMLYLELREITPDKPDNLYEIGFMLIGRKSIFMISGIMLINAFGLMLIYFITFGQTTASIM
mmetsp:Transcript_85117/g.117488  ORF Transcript_85117/g.117488 Transcript_85117/m.117488 type:complete len:156 (+) Transcript_85117:150-617(+)